MAIRIKAKKAGNIKHRKCWAREKSSEKLQQGADYHFLTTGSNNLKLATAYPLVRKLIMPSARF
jgi:hypothetical protein